MRKIKCQKLCSWPLGGSQDSNPEVLKVILLPGTAVQWLLRQSLSQLCQHPCMTFGNSTFSSLNIGLPTMNSKPLPVILHLVLQPGLHHYGSITPWQLVQPSLYFSLFLSNAWVHYLITETLFNYFIPVTCFQVPKLALVQEPILDDALPSIHLYENQSKSFSVLPGQQAAAAGGNSIPLITKSTVKI